MSIHTVRRTGRAIILFCAAVLSFSALYDLAILCGFDWRLAILFPVVVDAGAAVALADWKAGELDSQQFARRMTLALVATTILGNAVAHILDAYHLQPHWTVVVLVGALAPCVLIATWRLQTLDARHRREDKPVQPDVQEPDVQPDVQEPDVQPDVQEPDVQPDVQEPCVQPDARDLTDVDLAIRMDQARHLALTEGAGRGRLQDEVGLTEYQAKQLLRSLKNGQAVTA